LEESVLRKNLREFLTAQEVAKELRVHYKTVVRWITTGYLPAMKVGRHYRISREAYQEFLRKQNIQPPDTPTNP